MKKTLIIRMLIGAVGLILSAFTSQTPDFIILPANTPVIVTLDKTVCSDKVTKNEAITFTVERSVSIQYEKLIVSKSTAYGYIKKNDGNVLEIVLVNVIAIDGESVPLKCSLEQERERRRGDICIENGKSVIAFVLEDTKIRLSSK